MSVPLRAGPGFGATENESCAAPVPAREASAIHSALLDAVHGQPPAVVIATDPLPPVPATSWAAGEIEYLQPLACDTLTICPPIDSDPSRAGPVLGATENLVCPLPVPLFAPSARAIHGVAVDDVHVHAAPVATCTTLALVSGPTLTFGGVTVTLHPDA